MAGEWIRLRRGIRQNPKTVAMARHLSEDKVFADWWGAPLADQCASRNVTKSSRCVTFANVTRVTACALAELWGVLNDVIGDDCLVPYMTLQDIDDIVDVPGFGEAMEVVGWVVREDEKGLFFPNFLEHNAPQKTRPESKTPAQRAKEYRDRKRSGERVTARHGASHREEKSREEIEIHAAHVPTSDPAPPSRSRAKPPAIGWTPDGGWQGISDADRAEWAAAYPGAVLEQELAKATAWLRANPARCGKRNWRRFVVGWLSKCQDRGGTHREPGNRPGPPPVDAARRKFYRADAGRNMSDAEYAVWQRDGRSGGVVSGLAASLRIREGTA